MFLAYCYWQYLTRDQFSCEIWMLMPWILMSSIDSNNYVIFTFSSSLLGNSLQIEIFFIQENAFKFSRKCITWNFCQKNCGHFVTVFMHKSMQMFHFWCHGSMFVLAILAIDQRKAKETNTAAPPLSHLYDIYIYRNLSQCNPPLMQIFFITLWWIPIYSAWFVEQYPWFSRQTTPIIELITLFKTMVYCNTAVTTSLSSALVVELLLVTPVH